MNIKIAFVEKDKLYAKKFINAFGEFYPQAQIYSFTDIDKAVSALSLMPADVALVSEDIYSDNKSKMEDIHCKAVVITVNSKEVSKIDNYTAICKYQRIDHLNQAIMNIYSEISNIVIDKSGEEGETKTALFISGAGGCGCSTAAAAYAAYLAGKKLKVLYMDINPFGMADALFCDNSNYTMTDCLTAVIEQKNNLSIQLKNFAAHDKSGVYYYSQCVNALDWFDVTPKHLQAMIKSVTDSCEYDWVIIDAMPQFNEVLAYAAEFASAFFIISDGTTAANAKAVRLWEAADVYFKSRQKDMANMYVLYSCFSSNAKKINDERMREFITLPFLSGGHSTGDIVKMLSQRQYWE